MDKLKEQLAPIQKHIFWILCGCILGVSLFSWYSATSHLKTEQERLKGEIDNKTNAVTAIPSNHPNDNTMKGMDGLTQKYGEDVAAAWALLAANQEKVLVWSTSVFDADFIREVTPLRPPELTVKGTLDTEISQENRRLARNVFERVLPLMAETIGAKWGAKAQAGGGIGGMGGGGAVPEIAGGFGGAEAGAAGLDLAGAVGQKQEVDDAIVVWNPGNQSELLTEHFNFTTNESTIPTTLEVLYAQEDVWVLQNIMNIIKATNEYNGPISQRHQAAIKYIDSIRIGRSTSLQSVAGKVTSTSATSGTGSGMMSGMSGGMEMMSGAAMGGGMPGMEGGAPAAGAGPGMDTGAGAGMPGGGGAGPGMAGGTSMPGMAGGQAGTTSDPTDNRYVDQTYKPLKADRLKKAMRGEPSDAKDLLLAVAKRVPVRLNVKIDQRRLPVLLAECGNSKLPVEIKQVRVNRKAGGGFSSDGEMSGMGMGGGMSGMGGGMSGMAGGMGPGMMGGAMPGGEAAGGAFPGMGGGANNPNRSKVNDASLDPNEISVELYGIVYIYNPVNRTVLGLPPVETPAALPPPVTTPASTTPPAATPATNTGAAVTTPTSVTPGVN
jgi:hypothetical protein